jgi:hypothetical protein
MVKFQPSKLAMRVRFPLPAYFRFCFPKSLQGSFLIFADEGSSTNPCAVKADAFFE